MLQFFVEGIIVREMVQPSLFGGAGSRDWEAWEGEVTGTSNEENPVVIMVNFALCLNTNPEMCKFSHLNYCTQLLTAWFVICRHLNSE